MGLLLTMVMTLIGSMEASQREKVYPREQPWKDFLEQLRVKYSTILVIDKQFS